MMRYCVRIHHLIYVCNLHQGSGVQSHPCPQECTEHGNCKVEVQRKVVEKATIVTGAGSTIEYDAYAEVNAERKRCAQRIPVGKFRHDGDDHKCWSGERVIHTCTEQCDSCGYYCDQEFGHYERDGSFHDCVHGNMRNTIFYAYVFLFTLHSTTTFLQTTSHQYAHCRTEEVVDTGGDRKYRVGDSGTAEMCNIFCERQGRGHIHLEICQYADEGKVCEMFM